MSYGQGGSPMEQRVQFEMVFSVINGCFNDCVNDFKSNDLTTAERTCLTNCAQRSAGTQGLIMEIQQEMAGQMGQGGSGF